MVRIEETKTTIKITGHARREVCAMITALTMGFIQNAEAETNQAPAYNIKDGYFFIDMTQYSNNQTADLLARCLRRNLRQIATEYPTMVQYIHV